MKRLIGYAVLALAMLAPFAAMGAQCARPDKVQVQWDALPTGNDPNGIPYATVDHVEIWRGDAACSTNPTFTKQQSFAVDILQYDDLNIVQGKTYCYVGYSFDAANNKSKASNTAECSVPLAPLPVVPNLRAN